MNNHATNLNPDYALAYCNKGSKKNLYRICIKLIGKLS